jgi:hypothetical protein
VPQAFVLLRGASFTSRRDVLKVGDVKITADEQQSIPPWVGGAAMMVGVALIVAGGKRAQTSPGSRTAFHARQRRRTTIGLTQQAEPLSPSVAPALGHKSVERTIPLDWRCR